MSFILVLDIGTTNIKAFLFNKAGEISAEAKRRPNYIHDKPGQMEQDPKEIWQMSKEALEEVIKTGNIKADKIDAMGITTQRASWLLWNKETGEPLTNINTWQDKRAAQYAEKVSNSFKFKAIRGATKLISKIVKSPFFITASQLRPNSDHPSARTGYFLSKNPDIKNLIRSQGDKIAWGTTDSWILYNLTEEKLHVTDYSNASATGLLDPFSGEWNNIIYETFNVPVEILPEVRETRGDFGTTKLLGGGEIPIKAVIADQQASLYGLYAANPAIGSVKVTNGTGTFVDIFTGSKPFASKRKLYPFIAWALKGDEEGPSIRYMLEGLSHNCGNLIDFLQESLGFINNPAESEKLAMSVKDSPSSIFFVPALTSGLSFPFWDETSKAAIFGISLDTKKEHIVRAVLEGICFRIKDLIDGICKDTKIKVKTIKADGGVSQNKFILQFLSDILGIEVEHSPHPETTALGAAFMAGLESGYWKSQQELEEICKKGEVYTPKMSEIERKKRYKSWKNIIHRSLNYLND